jgi:hypothetical protein
VVFLSPAGAFPSEDWRRNFLGRILISSPFDAGSFFLIEGDARIAALMAHWI